MISSAKRFIVTGTLVMTLITLPALTNVYAMGAGGGGGGGAGAGAGAAALAASEAFRSANSRSSFTRFSSATFHRGSSASLGAAWGFGRSTTS